MKHPLGQLERTLITKNVLSNLRNDIIIGKIKPGTRLLETKTSTDFGVSRGPIRSAFQVLEQEGLIKIMSNGGAVVIGFTLKDAEDLFEFRAMLELTALKSIIGSPSVSYAPIVSAFESIRAHNKKTDSNLNLTENITILDIQFHYALMRMSEKKMLIKSWENISSILFTILNLTNSTYEQFDDFYVKHKELSDHVMQQKKETANMFEEHIFLAKNILIERLALKMENPEF